jgi:hypothetical protein
LPTKPLSAVLLQRSELGQVPASLLGEGQHDGFGVFAGSRQPNEALSSRNLDYEVTKVGFTSGRSAIACTLAPSPLSRPCNAVTIIHCWPWIPSTFA